MKFKNLTLIANESFKNVNMCKIWLIHRWVKRLSPVFNLSSKKWKKFVSYYFCCCKNSAISGKKNAKNVICQGEGEISFTWNLILYSWSNLGGNTSRMVWEEAICWCICFHITMHPIFSRKWMGEMRWDYVAYKTRKAKCHLLLPCRVFIGIRLEERDFPRPRPKIEHSRSRERSLKGPKFTNTMARTSSTAPYPHGTVCAVQQQSLIPFL